MQLVVRNGVREPGLTFVPDDAPGGTVLLPIAPSGQRTISSSCGSR